MANTNDSVLRVERNGVEYYQYLEQSTRDRLERYVWQLIAVVNVSDTKQQFIRAYQKQFGNANQLEML